MVLSDVQPQTYHNDHGDATQTHIYRINPGVQTVILSRSKLYYHLLGKNMQSVAETVVI